MQILKFPGTIPLKTIWKDKWPSDREKQQLLPCNSISPPNTYATVRATSLSEMAKSKAVPPTKLLDQDQNTNLRHQHFSRFDPFQFLVINNRVLVAFHECSYLSGIILDFFEINVSFALDLISVSIMQEFSVYVLWSDSIWVVAAWFQLNYKNGTLQLLRLTF